jgi:DNA-directed RNA polymerase specialized sigma24 family protein
MPGPTPVAISPEELLRRWLAESDPPRASELLEALMVYAGGTIRRIVGFRLSRSTYGHGRASPDMEDTCSEALASLLSKLAHIKAGGNPVEIQSFTDYTASIAFNACFEFFRKKYPERRGLADQLRYLLKHKPHFRLWKTGDIEVCGDAAWEGREPTSVRGSLRHVFKEWPSRRPSIAFLRAIFQVTGGPVEFESLVDEIADVCGIRPQFTELLDDEIAPPTRPSTAIEEVCAREYLQRLWTAICGLPLGQRRALLLNMKDSYDSDIGVLDWYGVASVSQIADALEIPPGDFAALWQELPISDKRIAARWGLSVQEVINRRSSARKTLKSQLKGIRLW